MCAIWGSSPILRAVCSCRTEETGRVTFLGRFLFKHPPKQTAIPFAPWVSSTLWFFTKRIDLEKKISVKPGTNFRGCYFWIGLPVEKCFFGKGKEKKMFWNGQSILCLWFLNNKLIFWYHFLFGKRMLVKKRCLFKNINIKVNDLEVTRLVWVLLTHVNKISIFSLYNHNADIFSGSDF